ncbi:uncharacterized protein [Ptychodera flava]|uniref:uncharacterized protein n=1 Tax=Ptychodera flava TaxID=63121 RepID=UPI00396A5365
MNEVHVNFKKRLLKTYIKVVKNQAGDKSDDVVRDFPDEVTQTSSQTEPHSTNLLNRKRKHTYSNSTGTKPMKIAKKGPQRQYQTRSSKEKETNDLGSLHVVSKSENSHGRKHTYSNSTGTKPMKIAKKGPQRQYQTRSSKEKETNELGSLHVVSKSESSHGRKHTDGNSTGTKKMKITKQGPQCRYQTRSSKEKKENASGSIHVVSNSENSHGRITDKVGRGPVQFYHDDKNLPICLKGRKYGVRTADAVNIILKPGDTSYIATAVPTGVCHNVAFLCDTTKWTNWKDILHDGLGSWKTKGTKTLFHMYSTTQVDDCGCSVHEAYKVTRRQYINQKSKDFHKVIVRVTKPDGIDHKLTFVQYFFDAEEHTIEVDEPTQSELRKIRTPTTGTVVTKTIQLTSKHEPGQADRITDKVRRGPVQFYNNDKNLPIYLKGRTKGLRTADAVNIILKPGDTSYIATAVPTGVCHNVAFLCDTTKWRDWKEILHDRLGSWETKGTKTLFYKHTTSEVDDSDDSVHEAYKVTRRQYINKKSKDFHKVIVRVTKPDGIDDKLTFVQYFFDAEEHTIEVDEPTQSELRKVKSAEIQAMFTSTSQVSRSGIPLEGDSSVTNGTSSDSFPQNQMEMTNSQAIRTPTTSIPASIDAMQSISECEPLADREMPEEDSEVEFYNDNPDLPILFKGRKSGIATAEAVMTMLHPGDKDNIATVTPTGVCHNVAFLCYTSESTNWKHLLDDGLGLWQSKGTKSFYYLYSNTLEKVQEVDSNGCSANEACRVIRRQYVNKSSPDFHRVVIRITKCDGIDHDLTFVQYYFDGNEHVIEVTE